MVTASSGAPAPALLELEAVGPRRFRNRHNLDNGRAAIFGGQPMLQGLAAARRTVDAAADGGWPAHNLTAHYLRAGAPDLPIDYVVEATRDGRRFASRRVLASQAGKPIFDMLCAFHDPEPGPAHQHGTAPVVAPPETLPLFGDYVAANADRLPAALVAVYGGAFPVELKVPDLETLMFERATVPVRNYWFRMPSAAPLTEAADHQSVLALLSDYWFAGTAAALHFRPSGIDRVMVVTLNHSLWFHAPARTDEWLLYATDSPWAADGRGLARGSIYDRAGRLVASAAQEISIRSI